MDSPVATRSRPAARTYGDPFGPGPGEGQHSQRRQQHRREEQPVAGRPDAVRGCRSARGLTGPTPGRVHSGGSGLSADPGAPRPAGRVDATGAGGDEDRTRAGVADRSVRPLRVAATDTGGLNGTADPGRSHGDPGGRREDHRTRLEPRVDDAAVQAQGLAGHGHRQQVGPREHEAQDVLDEEMLVHDDVVAPRPGDDCEAPYAVTRCSRHHLGHLPLPCRLRPPVLAA